MLANLTSISSDRVSLSNGIVFTLPPAQIKEYEISVGDQVSVPAGDLSQSAQFSLVIFRTNRHKADVSLTRNHDGFAGQVTFGLKVVREPIFPFLAR